MSKKHIVIWSFLTALAIAIFMVALFVPVVQIMVPEDGLSEGFSLFSYLKTAPFLNEAYPNACNTYFNADGPIWLATGGLLFNILLLFGSFAMLCACVFELAGMKMKNSAVKNNVLAKKLAYFVGWFTFVFAIFQMISYSVTTMMANGYVIFFFDFGCLLLAVLGIAVVILARKTQKRATVQKPSKVKNAIGFAVAGIAALLVFGSLFVPVFEEYFLDFGSQYTSIYGSSSAATLLSGDIYILRTMGDYPFGFCTYVCYAMALPCLFVFVYSVIGFIFTLKGKPANWLSSRIKRWSMTILVLATVVFMFVLCQIAVLWSTLVVYEQYCMLKWTAILVALLPFVPYVASTLVSVEKKQKVSADVVNDSQAVNIEEVQHEEPEKQQEEKPAKKRGRKKVKLDGDGWLEKNQIPNDVTAPLEKDVTRNLVDEPRITQQNNE